MGFLDRRCFLVLGLARSGSAVALLLAERGYEVLVCDDREAAVTEFIGGLSLDTKPRVQALTPEDAVARVEACDCLVPSPGVPDAHPVMTAARAAGVPVAGEIETAFHFSDARIVGVTGTNGKSTTVGVIGEILDRAGLDVVVAGNVGTPMAGVLRERDPAVFVLELSSFQLDTIDEFRCEVAVLLNVTPDHLDRYGNSMDAYAASKARILNRADADTLYVYNADDERASSLVAANPGASVAFSSAGPVSDGLYLDGDEVQQSRGGRTERLFGRDEFTPVGIHNIENAMAAAAAVARFDVSRDVLRTALGAYRPLPHRMEPVRVLDGVTWINDSKATNVDATVKSLESVEGRAVVILGGRDKEGDFARLSDLSGRVRAAVVIGEAAAAIHAALDGQWTLMDASSMEDAVARAREAAQSGDTVLLAPACASFDMFRTYEHRGEVFRDCVNGLGEEAA